MPEILKTNGTTDWSKIFMAGATAALFLIQGIHTMNIGDLKEDIVPRAEIHERYTTKNEAVIITQQRIDKLNEYLISLERRLDAVEGYHDNK